MTDVGGGCAGVDVCMYFLLREIQENICGIYLDNGKVHTVVVLTRSSSH